MTDRELLQQALDALETVDRRDWYLSWEIEIEAIRTRLAQPEPEPIVWINKDEIRYLIATKQNGNRDWKSNLGLVPEEGDVPLYAAPPKKEWVGLTDKEVVMLAYQSQENECTAIRLAEAKLKEKNNGNG